MKKRKTTEQFIKDSINIHGNKYDYSLVEYINNKTKVKIICKEHGIFNQRPDNHLKSQGCNECKGGIKLNNNIFIQKSKEIHSDKYDYSLVDYKNSYTKVKIICKEHGIFEQNPSDHIRYKGCSKCSNVYKSNKFEFINKSNIIHNNKYNYSLVKYINCMTKVNIICPKHGVFKQRPNDHLSNHGCPNCNESKGEKEISLFLDNIDIKYEKQKDFKRCKFKRKLKFDFYLPEHNICIEFDGEQHFMIKENWGGEKEFKNIQKRDKIKNEYCKNNKIHLIRIKYTDDLINVLSYKLKELQIF